jgi:putative ABC transport system permease protein
MRSFEPLRELRQTWRGLMRSPGFTVIVVLTLGLAIGANTAIFSLVEGVLLRPLPFADPGRLVVVWEDHSRGGGGAQMTLAPATVEDFRRSGAFSGLASQWTTPLTLTAAGEAEALRAAQVSSEFFRVLGVAPELGRAFGPGADAAERTAVLSDALWRRRFGADPGVLGRKLTLDGRPYLVIGVMPPALRVPLFLREPREATELWVPLAIPPPLAANREARVLQVIGRLASGRSLAAARSTLEAAGRRLAAEFPQSWAEVGVAVVPLKEQIVGDTRPLLLVLQATVGLVLLVACANLASLLLARALARGAELAVRSALGAGRPRLVRIVLGEGLLLALLGGGLGVLLAAWLTRLLVRLAPAGTPRLEDVGLDAATLAFGLALALGASLAFGLAPALQVLRSGSAGALRDEGRGSTVGRRQGWLRDALVVGQIALALVLLIGAGLLGRSYLRLRQVDPGFRAGHVLTMKLSLPESRYPEPGMQTRFFEELMRNLQAMPGVAAAGGITRLPLDTGWGSVPLTGEGAAVPAGEEPSRVGARQVTFGYFDALEIPLREGRGFAAGDDERSHPVVLINQTLARRLWPGRQAVGRRVRLGPPSEPWRDVVGVTGDVAYDSLASRPTPEVFVPHTQLPSDWFQVVVRAKGDPLGVAREVRAGVRKLDPDLPLVDVRPLAAQVSKSIAGPRFSAFLLASFAAVALALSATGVFGLTAYTVASRRREIGIRMALGARPNDLLRWLVGRMARLAVLGVAIGLAAGVLLARALASQLFGIRSIDLPTFVGGTLFLTFLCLLASYLPARRAARRDPRMALHND